MVTDWKNETPEGWREIGGKDLEQKWQGLNRGWGGGGLNQGKAEEIKKEKLRSYVER